MGKDTFIIYTSFYRPVSILSDRQLGRLFRAIFKYNLGEVVDVEEDIRMAFEFFKNQFEIDESKYQAKVKRDTDNGHRGGNPNFKKGRRNPYYKGKEITQDNPPLSEITQDNPPLSEITQDNPPLSEITQDNPPLSEITIDNDNEYDNDYVLKKTSSSTKQKKGDGDTTRDKPGLGRTGKAKHLQAGTLPAAQKEKSCAKKEKAPAERTAAQAAELLGTEAIIAEIERRAITAEQLAMANGLDAAAWQSVKAEIFTQWRFEGYSNTLQDALNHFANLVRKKAGDLRKGGGRQAGKSAVDAMVAGMLAAARSPEQERAEEEQFKRDFGL